MSNEKKSMDEVLASIRRIIRTDPDAAPPDDTQRGTGDETAESVLAKLRESHADEEFRKPLSKSDDPDETARAVLEELRRQAVAKPQAADVGAGKEPVKQPEPETPPDLDRDLQKPPKVDTDEEDVPDLEEIPTEDSLVLRQAEREPGRHAPEPPRSAPHRLVRSAPAAPRAADAPMMIDESALEAMIRRVVRDELTGDMGKRLTKNVQKLIQHEIAKARLGKK